MNARVASQNESFRKSFLAADVLLGTMLKTPTSHSTEIIAAVGFDFLVIDQEHAPFDQRDLDILALAAQASGIATLVRTSDALPSRLSGILDMGFAGVIVPHISSAKAAAAIVDACRYAGGHRGFSNSPRAGGYSARGMGEHMQCADRSSTVIAMIEDMEAVEAIDEILAVDGLDGVLIGRGDLTVAMGEESTSVSRVKEAVQRILSACRKGKKPAMLFMADTQEIPALLGQFASAFLVNSDQGFMKTGAQMIFDSFSKIRTVSSTLTQQNR